MPRTHGYAPKGHRCYGTWDWNAKGRINAIGAQLNNTLINVCLFEHSIDRRTFSGWIAEELLSILPAETVVVMDNASFHKGEKIETLFQMHGHQLEYLPTYSPDLNPIEHKWFQVKHIRRTTQCSVDEIFTTII